LYLVGGQVRNSLLGLPGSDWDVASRALPKEVAALLGDAYDLRQINPRLGTIVIRRGEMALEYTSFRTESYGSGGVHAPERVQVGASLEEDALRRDFSVNALYYDILAERVEDPTGRGLEDIARRKIRTTTEDPTAIIEDDGLRLLRMVRLAAELGFTIDRELFDKARQNRGLIRDISRERIAAELEKILLADQKYALLSRIPGHLRGLLFLRGCGLLGELFPELEEGAGLEQGMYHKYSVLFHSIYTAGWAPPTLVLRLAGLMHDVGKPRVWRETGRMVGHDKLGAKIAEARLVALGFPKLVCRNVAELVAAHMFDLRGEARESRIRRKVRQLGYQRFLQMADLREADVRGSGLEQGRVESAQRFRMVAEKMQREGAPLTPAELAISGREIMERFDLPPGPLVGALLEELLKVCVQKPSQNQPEKLYHYAKQWLKVLAKKKES